MKKYLIVLTIFSLIFAMNVGAMTEMTVNQPVTGLLIHPRVAYVYDVPGRIDRNIVDVFEDLGFEVEFIEEHDLPVDFSQFYLVFVGDELFKNHDLIPIGDIPSIVSNYRNTLEWGLTDNDGASQLAATSPLSVFKDGRHVRVYTNAYMRARIGVPYYYLQTNDKPEGAVQIAGTKRTTHGAKSGDVISYIYPGTMLTNGEIAEENICFYGIIKSKFWTPAAREMFEDCVRFAAFG